MIRPEIGEVWIERLSRQTLDRNNLQHDANADMRFLVLSAGKEVEDIKRNKDLGGGIYTYTIYNYEIDQIEEIELFLGGDSYEYVRIA